MIIIPTNPIHREDWKGATKWLNKVATDKDLIIPNEPSFSYYKGVSRNNQNPERVFIMDGYSMMPKNNRRNESLFTTKMLKEGFYKESMVKFGGENGHTVVFVFKRNDR